jgi:lysophospholipase L1-like esterase
LRELERGIFNLTERWVSGLTSSFRRTLSAGQDFAYVNVGDSIATGRIGIPSKTRHYAAVAALTVARHLSVPVRSTFHTADELGTDDRMLLSGPGWRIEEGALYGGGSYVADAGADGTLTYLPEPGYRTARICHLGGFDYSVDNGASWSRRNEPVGRIARTEIAVGVDGVVVRALPDSGCHVYWLRSVNPDQPGIVWYTSGIGATRTGDLHRILSQHREAGYRAYGAAAPDLLTLEIGVNDTIHADVETIRGSRAALAAVVARLHHHGVGTIALIGAVPVRADFQPGPWRVADAYREIYRPIALEAGVPLLDISLRWGDYYRAFEMGYLADQVHPTQAGHADAGEMVAALLLSATTAWLLGSGDDR